MADEVHADRAEQRWRCHQADNQNLANGVDDVRVRDRAVRRLLGEQGRSGIALNRPGIALAILNHASGDIVELGTGLRHGIQILVAPGNVVKPRNLRQQRGIGGIKVKPLHLHPGRVDGGEIAGDIAFACRNHPFQLTRSVSAQGRLHACDARVTQRAVQRATEWRVLRRILAKRGPPLAERHVGDDVDLRRNEPIIVRNGRHDVVIARKRPEAAMSAGMRHRAFRTHASIFDMRTVKRLLDMRVEIVLRRRVRHHLLHPYPLELSTSLQPQLIL